MDELDFTRPSQDSVYDPAIARSFFESLGREEAVPDGKQFFGQDQASDRMYLLVEGQVKLVRGGRTLDIIKPGEIFGEMATITGRPRTAAAVATAACRALSLEAKQFGQAIQTKPEFARMLMGILINRLRLSNAILGRVGGLPARTERDVGGVFDKALVDRLAQTPNLRAPLTFPANRVIMKEGDVGFFMYVVLRGTIAISVKSRVVERVGAGSILGEMALVDQSPRAASAVAETESQVLPLNQNDFLSLVRSSPDFAVALLKALAERLRQMTARAPR